jgi:hypothetical protein
MVYTLSLVPVDKIVEYYEEVISQRIEDKTGLEAGEDRDFVDNEDTEDDTCWRCLQKQLDAFVAYLDYIQIGRNGDGRSSVGDGRSSVG